VDWLKAGAVLGEIGLADDDVLVLKKKFFFNDANIDRNDPVQLHLLYVQCRDSVVESKYPTTKDEARDLAAIQCQVTFGDHTAARTTGQWLK
jgi:talin